MFHFPSSIINQQSTISNDTSTLCPRHHGAPRSAELQLAATQTCRPATKPQTRFLKRQRFPHPRAADRLHAGLCGLGDSVAGCGLFRKVGEPQGDRLRQSPATTNGQYVAWRSLLLTRPAETNRLVDMLSDKAVAVRRLGIFKADSAPRSDKLVAALRSVVESDPLVRLRTVPAPHQGMVDGPDRDFDAPLRALAAQTLNKWGESANVDTNQVAQEGVRLLVSAYQERTNNRQNIVRTVARLSARCAGSHTLMEWKTDDATEYAVITIFQEALRSRIKHDEELGAAIDEAVRTPSARPRTTNAPYESALRELIEKAMEARTNQAAHKQP
jgi:hypothetical protein